MAREYLGLFDKPPSRQEVRLCLAIVVSLVFALMFILPAHEIRLRKIDAFIPLIDAIMLISELVIASLLYAQAAVFRSRALTVLATGFLVAALLLLPHALTFPGAFAPDGLLDAGVNTTAWIYTFRRTVFGVVILLYVKLKLADASTELPTERPAERIIVWVFAATAIAAAVTLLATRGHDLLPPFYLNRFERNEPFAAVHHVAVFILYIVASIALFRKRSSVLDAWLLVALSAWLAEAFLNIQIEARFTLGWYGLFSLMLASNIIIMVALLTESNRLYTRLALSQAARGREREARLMSMDALAAAFSHELGQPLAAVGLNAAAGLEWLMAEKPDVKNAIISLRAVTDSGRRAFEVIKSIRGTFAGTSGRGSEFSINDLVHETAALLDRELVEGKVSLQLELDGALPPVLADRVQMQRVVINLVMNAIESLQSEPNQCRRITIRTSLLDGKDLLLRISDSGVGITPENMDHIFNTFFTTKSSGTGLGLSLCRSIVEEHGGRLWATNGDTQGANFNIRLPRNAPH